MPDSNTPTAPTVRDTPTTPNHNFVTADAFFALMEEFNQRLGNADAVNAIIVAEVDALAAEVAQLKAAC